MVRGPWGSWEQHVMLNSLAWATVAQEFTAYSLNCSYVLYTLLYVQYRFHDKKGKRSSKDEWAKDVHRKPTKRGNANKQLSYGEISGLLRIKAMSFFFLIIGVIFCLNFCFCLVFLWDYSMLMGIQ